MLFNKLENIKDKDEGCLYILVDATEKHFKLGVTKGDVTKRIKQLNTGNAVDLKVHKHYRTYCYKELEKLLHKIFSHKQVNREWFELVEEDFNKIDQIVNLVE